MKRGLSPLVLTGIMIGLMIVLSILIVLFKGELVDSTNTQISFQDRLNQICSNDIEFEFSTPCLNSSNLQFKVKNAGDVEVEGIQFTVQGAKDDYVTQNNVPLSVNTQNQYKLNFLAGEKASKISIIPAVKLDDKVVGCSATEYIVTKVDPVCRVSNGSGSGGGSGGGGGGGGGGGSSGSDDSGTSCTDLDGDGYGAGCSAGTDCNDNDNLRFVNHDAYNDADQDSDGAFDSPIVVLCSSDGVGLSNWAILTGDLGLNHLSLNNVDCDDNNPYVYPGNLEVCNGIDQNCNLTDENITGECECFYDSDCEDGDLLTYDGCMILGNTSECYHCVDSDGDGYDNCEIVQGGDDYPADCNDSDVNRWELFVTYNDFDSDSHGAITSPIISLCSSSDISYLPRDLAINKLSLINDDCEDDDSSVHPQVQEICDRIDQNCVADDEIASCECYNDIDCDDGNSSTVDNCFMPVNTFSMCQYTPISGCVNLDGDGYDSCNPPEGDAYLADCDDTVAEIWRQADVYIDADGDSYGRAGLPVSLCIGTSPTPGWVENGEDCNDEDIHINPSAIDVCDNKIDENCDGNDDCSNCIIDEQIEQTGCICDGFIHYSGYCCLSGWSSKYCSDGGDGDDILQPSPKRISFWELVLKRFFLF